MKRIGGFVVALSALIVVGMIGCSQPDSKQEEAEGISGRIDGGLRVLTLDPVAMDQKFTIYRGDYVRVEQPGGGSFEMQIPALEVAKQFPVPEGEKPYFKVTNPGTYPFVAGDATGVIEAIEYSAAAYREVNSQEAVDFIANLDPLILDVRTPREYSSGHLEGAMLMPVQVLQRKLVELESHKNDPVFVYCRTGNRSTVAAKILIDNGFTQVVNLRRGIVEWKRAGYPTVK